MKKIILSLSIDEAKLLHNEASQETKLEAYFTKTLSEKTLIEIEISDEDLKKIESKEINLDECLHDYAFDYDYEVIEVLSSEVVDNEIKEINHIK